MSRFAGWLHQLVGAVFVLAVGSVFTPASLVGGEVAEASAPPPREVVERRTETSKTVENANGTFTTSVFLDPIHYRDGEGNWSPISSRLVPSEQPGYALRNEANAFSVSFKDELEPDYLRFTAAGQSFTMSLEGATRRPVAAGRSDVSYHRAFSGVDLRYDVVPSGVKETLVLADRNVPTRYRFSIDAPEALRMEANELPDGSWAFHGSSRPEPLFVLAAPTIVEAPGAQAVDGTFDPVLAPSLKRGAARTSADPGLSLKVTRTGARFVVELSLDPVWLRDPARRFPLLLDPTITIQGTSQYGNFDFNCPTCMPLADDRVRIGTSAAEIWRPALQFNLSTIPAGATVSNAQLRLYYDGKCVMTCAPGSHQLDLHRITAGWSTASTTSAITYDATAAATLNFSTIADADVQWLSWNITSLVNGWRGGTYPNHGMLLRRNPDPLSANGPTAPSGRYTFEATLKPKLEITYSGDAVELYPISSTHSNGADLEWSRYVGESGAQFQKYDVHRSSAAGFTPTTSTLLATIPDVDVTRYRDTTAAPSKTFHYKVVANTSASNERSATLNGTGNASKTLQPLSAAARATTIGYEPSVASCANDGADDDLWLAADTTAVRRALLFFDVSDLPTTATVSAARLSLWRPFNAGFNNAVVDLHRVTTAWKEGSGLSSCTGDGATWYDAEGGAKWATSGGDYDPAVVKTVTTSTSGDWDNYYIEGLAREWVSGQVPNLGVLLKLRDETQAAGRRFRYYADDFSVAPTLRPKLYLVYTDGSKAIAPTVSASTPAPGELLSGTAVKLSAAASDDRRVDKVEFLVDGGVVGSDSSAPFELIWNSTTATNASHSFSARATDDAGNITTSATVTATVENRALPTTAITAPAAGATVAGTTTFSASAAAASGLSVSKVEFYVDDVRVAEDATAPYSIAWNTLDQTLPAYDGARILKTKAYDSAGRVTDSSTRSVTVANTSGTKYKATITSTLLPLSVGYDPAAATQEKHGVDVTVANNSTTSWSRSSIYLRYRWYSPDEPAVVTDSGNISIGTTDLAKSSSRTIRVLVDPPALPVGVEKAQYKLRFDLFDTATGGGFFAAKGNQPLENPVIVNKILRTALGLERYYHYVGEELGAGMQHLVNVANGNSLVRWTPFQAPGRGLSTVVDLTYNALEKKCECPAGNNWSLSISSLTRFGNPIDVHPNNADTIAGRSNKYIEFTDGDGTTHRFTSTDGVTYQEPGGVHLFLRKHSDTDVTRKWALTRPDRVTFYYDSDGFPTSVVDRNGRTLRFTLETTPPGEDPGGPKKRIVTVSDDGGRAFTIAYYSKAEAKKAHVRGKIKRITDHSGSALDFEYYEDGNLLRLVQRGGTTADGVSAPDRSFVFTYTTSSGDGPAIPLKADRLAPNPRTPNQSTRLYSVIDPRGAAEADPAKVSETLFAYLGSGNGADRWKLASRTDRAGAATTFAYDITNRVTTVTEPLARTSTYGYDVDGKVTTITNPKNEQTFVTWDDAERHVTRVSEAGGGYTKYAYNANGYLTEEKVAIDLKLPGEADDVLSQTLLEYQNIAVDAKDVAANWKSGRSIPHLSQLVRKTEPNGVATTADLDDYQWNFSYTAAGNLQSVTEPGPEAVAARPKTTYGYDASGNGDLRTITDPRGNVTQLNGYDANGFATSVVDAESQTTRLSYDADGLLRFVQDAEHTNSTGLETVADKSVFYYDPFHRLARQSTPKSTAHTPNVLIFSSAAYDPNDNVVAQFAPDYGTYTSGAKSEGVFDAMDRQTAILAPHDPGNPDPTKSAPRRTEFAYDAAGRMTRTTLPAGVASATANDFVTEVAYDELDRVTKETRYPADGLLAGARVSHYCYDLAGDLRSVTAPRNGRETDPAKKFTVCPAAVSPGSYTPTTASFTTKLEYHVDHSVRSEMDPLGGTRSVEYDANRDVTKTIDEEQRERTRSYTERGQLELLEETFTPGRAKGTLKTLYRYDAAGNLVLEASPRAIDVLGLAGTVAGADYVTEYGYDKVNRQIKTRLPKDASTPQAWVHQRYDKIGRLVSTSAPVANADAAFMTSTQPADRELRYDVGYFDTGWIRQTDDPGKGVVGFDYTAEGWQTVRQPTSNVAETWTYYADGLLRSNTDAAGQLTNLVYDLNGNLDGSSDAGVDHATEVARELELDYNGFDEVTELRERKVGQTTWRTTRYAYDLNANLDVRTDDVGASDERVHDFEYDQADRLLWQRDNGAAGCADDRRLSYGYSPADRLLQEITRTAGVGCGADPASWPVTQQTAYSYFTNGDLHTQRTWNSETQNETNLVEDHTLAYLTAVGEYVNGNHVSDTFRLKGPDSQCAASACTASYRYDARERLIRHENGLPLGFKTTTDYTLDGQPGLPLLGNVTREVRRLSKPDGSIERTITDSSYNAASQVLSSATPLPTTYAGAEPSLPAYPLAPDTWYRWNQANGNLKCTTDSAAVTLADCNKEESLRPAGVRSWYRFDARDRMRDYVTASDRAEYVYDAYDRVARQWESHTRPSPTGGSETRARDTEFTYLGLSAELVRETQWVALGDRFAAIDNPTQLSRTRGYSYDAYGRRTGMTDTPVGGSGSTFSYARNVHGDVSLLLGATGTATASYGYTPYGAEEKGLTTRAESTLPDTSSPFRQTEPLNAFRFNDKRYDTGSGSIDMGARRYGPDTGRFLQNDYYLGALDDLDLSTDPLTNNRYGFASGNPVSFVEVDGHHYIAPKRWKRCGIYEDDYRCLITPAMLRQRADSPIPWVLPELCGWGPGGRPVVCPWEDEDFVDHSHRCRGGKFHCFVEALETASWFAPGGGLKLGAVLLVKVGPKLGRSLRAAKNLVGLGGKTAGGRGFKPGKWLSHFEKHGHEFGYKTAVEYLRGAQRLTRGGAGVGTFTRKNGDTLFFRYRTREFAVLAKDGRTIRTYFRPKEGIRYWLRQVKKG